MNTINTLFCFIEAERKLQERSAIALQIQTDLEQIDPDLWYMRHAEQARYQRALDEQIQWQSLPAFRGYP